MSIASMPMRAMVVCESMFGNTEQVARAVARGLSEAGARVTTIEARQAPALLPDTYDLLVVGAPAHAFPQPPHAARGGVGRNLVGVGRHVHQGNGRGGIPA
jgi:flavorubredoxin